MIYLAFFNVFSGKIYLVKSCGWWDYNNSAVGYFKLCGNVNKQYKINDTKNKNIIDKKFDNNVEELEETCFYIDIFKKYKIYIIL